MQACKHRSVDTHSDQMRLWTICATAFLLLISAASAFASQYRVCDSALHSAAPTSNNHFNMPLKVFLSGAGGRTGTNDTSLLSAKWGRAMTCCYAV